MILTTFKMWLLRLMNCLSPECLPGPVTFCFYATQNCLTKEPMGFRFIKSKESCLLFALRRPKITAKIEILWQWSGKEGNRSFFQGVSSPSYFAILDRRNRAKRLRWFVDWERSVVVSSDLVGSLRFLQVRTLSTENVYSCLSSR